MKRIIALLLAAVMLFSAAGCASSKPSAVNANVKPNPVAGTASDERFENILSDFSVELFKQSTTEKNAIISPLSVMLALAMVQNGARGETLSQMEKVFGELDTETLDSYLYSYVSKLTSNDNVKFNIANSIWLRERIAETISRDFLQKNADYFDADVFNAPFDDNTCGEINDWISDKTEGLIKNALSNIPDSTIMYLINAIVFDGEWSEPYDDYQVRNGLFTSLQGKEQKAEFLCSAESAYLDDGKATGFIKSYRGGRFAFAALLPNDGMDINEYIASLTGEGLHDTFADPCYDYEVITKLPKFKSDFSASLVDTLSAMGMPALFSSDADLSGMNDGAGGLYVSDIIHKGYIEVDQLGTKAGAVTIVSVDEACMMEEPERRYVTLDRPFVYAIIDRETSTPVFLGVLNTLE